MSYNQNFDGDGTQTTGTSFKPGVNENCKMQFFGLKAEEGKEAKLVVEWINEEGGVINEWKFRVNDNEDQKKFFEDRVKPNQRREQSYAEWITGNKKDLYYWIKHVVCAYTNHEKFEEAVATLPQGATFEQFINKVASLLPADYAKHTGNLKCGYHRKGGAFLKVPSHMYMGRFWKLHADTREERDLGSLFNKYFTEQPFPSQDTLRPAAEKAGEVPSQDQGETKW